MPALLLPYRGVHPRIDPEAFVAPTATVIGDVVVGPQANIWFGCIVRGDVHEIRIGARTNIQDGTVIHATKHENGTYIGADVSVGHLALLHGCTLEDGAFVGMNAVVMDGAVVEGGAMVAAGALVTPGKRVARGEIWAGRPAQYWRPLAEKELAVLARTVPRYVGLAKDYKDAGM